MKMNEIIIDVLEANDWSLSEIHEQDGVYYGEIESYSPAGENLVCPVWFNGTPEGFAKSLDRLAYDFDVDEHVELWIDSRGENGMPETIRELVEDAEAIKEMLNKVAERVRESLWQKI